MDNKKSIPIVCGGVLGAVNGLFGGGGGMIAVPLLSNTLNYSQKEAHATAILVILPVCAISAIVYLINGYTDLQVIIPATIGNIVGGLVGAKFLGKISTLWTQIIFVSIMLYAGLRMVFA